MNRELSWLKFNERVLEEAENKKVPLCERLNFAAIYQSNLDEFFMVRVGSLVDQMLLKKDIRDNKTNLTPEEQIKKILAEVGKLNRSRNVVYDEIMEELEEYDICITDFKKMNEKESEYVKRYFQGEIAPIIFPTIVAKRQPFPFLRNKEIYAVVVLETKSGKEKLGIIPCSSGMFKRLIELPGKRGTYILAEEVILHYMPEIFKGYRVKAKSLIRITRNADIDADALYDEDLDYRDFMVEVIKQSLYREKQVNGCQGTRNHVQHDSLSRGSGSDHHPVNRESCRYLPFPDGHDNTDNRANPRIASPIPTAGRRVASGFRGRGRANSLAQRRIYIRRCRSG